jgi:hypothetical protein
MVNGKTADADYGEREGVATIEVEAYEAIELEVRL